MDSNRKIRHYAIPLFLLSACSSQNENIDMSEAFNYGGKQPWDEVNGANFFESEVFKIAVNSVKIDPTIKDFVLGSDNLTCSPIEETSDSIVLNCGESGNMTSRDWSLSITNSEGIYVSLCYYDESSPKINGEYDSSGFTRDRPNPCSDANIIDLGRLVEGQNSSMSEQDKLKLSIEACEKELDSISYISSMNYRTEQMEQEKVLHYQYHTQQKRFARYGDNYVHSYMTWRVSNNALTGGVNFKLCIVSKKTLDVLNIVDTDIVA